MAQRQFDELNVIQTEINRIRRLEIMREFFDEMELPSEEKEARYDLAVALYAICMALFDEYEKTEMTDDEDIEDYLYNFFYSKFDEAVRKSGMSAKEGMIGEHSAEIVATTLTNSALYFVSEDRAMMLAENEANAVGNNDREVRAISEGKTTKTWITMQDEKVRQSHWLVDGETIGIYDTFKVGEYEMLYPLDPSAGPEETVNCRCICEYQ